MKELAPASQQPSKKTPIRRRTQQHQPAKETQTTLYAYFEKESPNHRTLRRRNPPMGQRVKPSIGTRAGNSTVAGSSCPSNFSFGRGSNKFQRLRKQIEQLRSDSKPVSAPAVLEVIKLHSRAGKSFMSFNCYSDRQLRIPERFRDCLHKPSTDFDVQSTQQQINTSVRQLTNELRLAARRNRPATFGGS